MKDKSKMVDCYISPRPGETDILFRFESDGSAVVRLEGYAIIPMEMFEHLTELAESAADGIAQQAISHASRR